MGSRGADGDGRSNAAGGRFDPDAHHQAQIARLAGQREDYLQMSMEQYQRNQRSGIDTNMVAVLYGVPAAGLAARARYMAQQK